jgi:hypothetical protein
MLYGSRARGDAQPWSDVDLFVVAASPSPNRRLALAGWDVYLTIYSAWETRQLFASRSLFALHLFTEGMVLWDRRGALGPTVDAYAPAPSLAPTWRDLSAGLQLAAEWEHASGDELRPLVKLARFVLRSALVAEHLERTGRPDFQTGRLCAALGYHETAALLTPSGAGRPTSWLHLRRRLDALLQAAGRIPRLAADGPPTGEREKILNAVARRIRRGEEISYIKVFALRNGNA